MKIEVEVKIDIDIEKGDIINDKFLIVSIGDTHAELFNLLSCKIRRYSKDEFASFINYCFNSDFEIHNAKDIINIDYANDEE